MFGGEEIRISGPCFYSEFNILARIRETNDTFQCTAINDISAACIMPSVFRTGQVTLEINPYGMGWNYSSTYQIGTVYNTSIMHSSILMKFHSIFNMEMLTGFFCSYFFLRILPHLWISFL